MSVLITGKVKGDMNTFRQALAERADEFAALHEEAVAAGAIHHRFGIGDGFVLFVDEWGSAEQFEAFFANPELQAFIGQIGADGSPPDITVTEAVDSADQF